MEWKRQEDVTQSTQGDPAHADSKLRPERILQWERFPSRQMAIWNDIVGSDFMRQRLFLSLRTLEESEERIHGTGNASSGAKLHLKSLSRTRTNNSLGKPGEAKDLMEGKVMD
ncbi:MAG: hypothetical protein M1816_004703 [Peltula sp. TS41687]|nr:MAG: hypothetical protein M1816_004703 [Peltula sp. TS41687]